MTDLITDDDMKRMQEVAAELRALDTVRILRHALAGDPHWRFEARVHLELIDLGVLPENHHA